jgi:glycosyltransferase involved in cell wall biosynthesis
MGTSIREVAVRNGARYLRVEKPGVSLAKNVGARNATGDIVAFLDDDAVPSSSWLAHLVQPFRDTHVGCVTSKTEPEFADFDRGEYELLGYVRGPDSPNSISLEDPNWFTSACFGGIGISPGLSIRKSFFSEWAGFCERLGPGTPIIGTEEGHAFLDLVRFGHSIQYASEAVVFHPVPLPNHRMLQQRYYANLAASTAFLLMLIFEERGCRWLALKYLIGKLRRVSSLWSRGTGPQHIKLAPRWRVALARARGIISYAHSLAGAGWDNLSRKTQQAPRSGPQSALTEHEHSATPGVPR